MKTPAELAWQREIVDALTQEPGDLQALRYRELSAADYDRDRAFIASEFTEFIRTTQGDALARHGETLIHKALVAALDARCVVDVWRKGFSVGSDTVFPAFWRPRDAVDPSLLIRYQANRLCVIQELTYHAKEGAQRNRLDLALFVNGIPVVTVELKNQFTGQGTADAEHQYACDRSPEAPIFNFPHRAIAHFAVDRQNARMATRINGDKTFFLPFNRGSDGGRGNPPLAGYSSTAYLWRQIDVSDERLGCDPTRTLPAVWQPDRLLDILQSYATLEPLSATQTKALAGRPEQEKLRQRTLIFPRFHQYDAVLDMVAHTQKHGAGHRYLVKHSTGSGKSYTMAWLAQQLVSLHRDAGRQKVFGTVLIVTDRIQLDDQLRELVRSVNPDANLRVAETTKQLGTFLVEVPAEVKSSRIITSTLHKFFHLEKAKPKGTIKANVAIIIDEAHSSQGSDLQNAMESVLNALSGSSAATLSYYAFTATPRERTREVFGIGPKGEERPFHTYGMRQAREEGFIVDVLQNMHFYKQHAQLGALEPDKKVHRADLKAAAAAMQELIEKKSACILDHFEAEGIADKLQVDGVGQGKAMVLAPSIPAGIRYFHTLRRLIEERGRPWRVLIAFSGEEFDPDVIKEPGVKPAEHRLTEASLNDDQVEGVRIADRLRETHQILVAVNKFQTGFNEPRLMAMYVDKPLRDINAVQTLSRLNRQFKGMKTPSRDGLPHVVDFRNTPEELVGAFIAEDEGSMEAYTFLNAPFIEALYAALNQILSEDLVPEFLTLEADFHAAGADAKSGDYASFFAARYQAYTARGDEQRFAYRVDLRRLQTYWPLACLVLRDAYPPQSELRARRDDYRRMAKRFFDYIIHTDSGDANAAAGTFAAKDVFVDGSASLLDLGDATDLWAQHLGTASDADEAAAASTDELAASAPSAEPMVYTVAKQRKVVPKSIALLVARYNALMGAAAPTHAEAPEDQPSRVLQVLEGLANRVHEDAVLRPAARSNSERDYREIYKRVLAYEIEDEDAEPDTEGRKILKFLSRQALADFDDLAADSYRIHNDQEAA